MQQLIGDSGDYELLTLGVQLSKDTEGLTCELGLRQGGGTKFIVDELSNLKLNKTHIAIDPYGNIEYYLKENEKIKLDYTNSMRDNSLPSIIQYCSSKNVNFVFFNLEDSEFFKRFSDGVPIYQEYKKIINQYSLVHIDAGHRVEEIKRQIDFFNARMVKGSVLVFDDVNDFYNHDEIEQYLFPLGWNLIKKKYKKGVYQKI